MKLTTKFQIVYIITKVIEWLFYLTLVICFVLFVASAGESPISIGEYLLINIKLFIVVVISSVIAWINFIVRECIVKGYHEIMKSKK